MDIDRPIMMWLIIEDFDAKRLSRVRQNTQNAVKSSDLTALSVVLHEQI